LFDDWPVDLKLIGLARRVILLPDFSDEPEIWMLVTESRDKQLIAPFDSETQ
jgi:hypothetical protein